MARTIQKKVISDDLLFTDAFDESMLDKIEGELGRSHDRDLPDERSLNYAPDKSGAGTASGGQGRPIIASEPMEPAAFERDLPSPEFLDKLQEEAFAESSTDGIPQGDSEQQQTISKKVSHKKMLLFAAAASVLLIITGGLTYLLWPTPKKTEAPRLDFVRQRIVIPVYEHEMNLFIFAGTQGKEDLLKVDLGLDFASFKAHKQFKEKQVYYTDLIYGLLREKSLPDNSVEMWARILEQELPARLKDDHPEIPLNSIRMKSFHRL
jgi:hypothetical protein